MNNTVGFNQKEARWLGRHTDITAFDIDVEAVTPEEAWTLLCNIHDELTTIAPHIGQDLDPLGKQIVRKLASLLGQAY